MVRYGKWKFISYTGFEEQDLLFDLEKDPQEFTNIAMEQPETVKQMKTLLLNNWITAEIIANSEFKKKQRNIQVNWGRTVKPDDPILWHPPEDMIKNF
jgi:choline-sulfatase